MDVIRVFQVLFRRWAVVLPVVLLGIAGTVYAASSIPDEYTATGSLIVVDRSGGAGEVTPAILAEALQDGATRDAVADETGSADYSVTAGEGGILRVSAGGDDPALAASTANAVLDRIQVVIDQRREQSGGAASAASIEILNRATESSVVRDENLNLSVSASARLIGAGGTAVGGDRASRLLAAALGSSTVREQVAAGGGVDDYGVSSSRDLPTIGITAVGTSATQATTTVDLVTAQADVQLAELLSLQGSSATVAAEPLAAAGGVTVDGRNVLRSIVALLALTAGLGVAAAFTAEALAEHRQDRTGPAGNRSTRIPAGGRPSRDEPASEGKDQVRSRRVRESLTPVSTSPERAAVVTPSTPEVREPDTRGTAPKPHPSGAERRPAADHDRSGDGEHEVDPFPEMPVRTR